jgi:MFS family permease
MVVTRSGTAACALAPNLETLAFFRFISSLGIGGDGAAGAAMVAEVVPEHRRVRGRRAPLYVVAARALSSPRS